MQAAVHQCKVVVDFMEEKPLPHPVTINDEGLYKHAKKVSEIMLGESNMQMLPVTMGAEDFSFYTQKFPAAMFVVGTKNMSLKSDQHLHSPRFFIDEEALPIGAALHAAVAVSYLDIHGVEDH